MSEYCVDCMHSYISDYIRCDVSPEYVSESGYCDCFISKDIDWSKYRLISANDRDSLVARTEKAEAELLELRQELDNNNDMIRELDNARVVAETEVERLRELTCKLTYCRLRIGEE